MKKLIHSLIISFVAALSVAAPSAHATAITSANFSAPATGGSGGYYYFSGMSATQTFASSLSTVDHINLTLNPAVSYTTQNLGFTFYLNGLDVGQVTFTPGQMASAVLSFDFASVASVLGNYTLLMSVTTPVCSGCGALTFSSQNALALSQSAAVPEPMPLALIGLGLIGMGVLRKRRTA